MIYEYLEAIIGPNMINLTIQSIINPEQDSELTTYKILGTLKEYLASIRKFKIYPGLSELIGLVVRLENLRKSISKPKDSDDDLLILDDEISTSGELQPAENYTEEGDNSTEYINWVISQINPILEEGIAVYNFVDQNMELKLINGDPLYKKEGYLIIPDNIASVFNIYKFNSLLVKSDIFPERSIKTEFIQSIPAIESDNIRIQYRTLLNYVGNNTLPVYVCDTELDFPYEESLFQIARKKLLSRLSL
jgi:hypothetical protein